jgi:hypothetical protein
LCLSLDITRSRKALLPCIWTDEPLLQFPGVCTSHHHASVRSLPGYVWITPNWDLWGKGYYLAQCWISRAWWCGPFNRVSETFVWSMTKFLHCFITNVEKDFFFSFPDNHVYTFCLNR